MLISMGVHGGSVTGLVTTIPSKENRIEIFATTSAKTSWAVPVTVQTLMITDLLNHQRVTVANLEFGTRGTGRNICAGATPVSG